MHVNFSSSFAPEDENHPHLFCRYDGLGAAVWPGPPSGDEETSAASSSDEDEEDDMSRYSVFINAPKCLLLMRHIALVLKAQLFFFYSTFVTLGIFSPLSGHIQQVLNTHAWICCKLVILYKISFKTHQISEEYYGVRLRFKWCFPFTLRVTLFLPAEAVLLHRLCDREHNQLKGWNMFELFD